MPESASTIPEIESNAELLFMKATFVAEFQAEMVCWGIT